jgi:hypothetical protein
MPTRVAKKQRRYKVFEILPKMKSNYDLITLAAQKQGLFSDGLSRNFVKGRSRFHLLSELNQTVADLPLVCLDDELLEEFRRLSYEAELALQPSIASSQHNAAFDKAVTRKKFCNVDAEKLLQDEHWRSYIAAMQPK